MLRKVILSLKILLIGGLLPNFALAVDNYDPVTKILTIDAVTLGNTKYLNVTIRLDQFQVLGVGSAIPIDGVADSCTPEMFTIDKFNTIQPGMTLDQVNQVIGCKFDPGSIVRAGAVVNYTWASNGSSGVRLISVYFDASTNKVTSTLGSSFKSSAGF
jgi:hypothetical protein